MSVLAYSEQCPTILFECCEHLEYTDILYYVVSLDNLELYTGYEVEWMISVQLYAMRLYSLAM